MSNAYVYCFTDESSNSQYFSYDTIRESYNKHGKKYEYFDFIGKLLKISWLCHVLEMCVKNDTILHWFCHNSYGQN